MNDIVNRGTEFWLSARRQVRQLKDMVIADNYFEMRKNNMNFQVILNQTINGRFGLQTRIDLSNRVRASDFPGKQGERKLKGIVIRAESRAARQWEYRTHNGILRADVALFPSSLTLVNYVMETLAVSQKLYQAQQSNIGHSDPLWGDFWTASQQSSHTKTESSVIQRRELSDLMPKLTKLQNTDETSHWQDPRTGCKSCWAWESLPSRLDSGWCFHETINTRKDFAAQFLDRKVLYMGGLG